MKKLDVYDGYEITPEDVGKYIDETYGVVVPRYIGRRVFFGKDRLYLDDVKLRIKYKNIEELLEEEERET